MKIANLPWQQLLENQPLTTLAGCAIWILLATCLGCGWLARAKRRGESPGILVILLVAIACTLGAYLAGFVSNRLLEKQQDFARADAQYIELDSERGELYDNAMELIARVDHIASQAERLARTSTTEADIQQLLESNSGIASELGDLQQEAAQQHLRAKQIRGQFRELSIVVHTGKMIAELDKQAARLRQIEQELKVLLSTKFDTTQ